jgi:Fe-S oxidoreductase
VQDDSECCVEQDVCLQVAFFYLNSTDSEFRKIGATILHALRTAGISVRLVRCWSTSYYHVQGYKDNPFLQMVRDTYEDTRSEYPRTLMSLSLVSCSSSFV